MKRSTYLHRLALAKKHSAATLLASGDICFPLAPECSVIWRPGQKAKYLKTSASGSHLFVPKRNYEFTHVVVCEGIFDALVLADTQPFNVPVLPVAILGCNINQELHDKIASIARGNEIVLALDNDKAGKEATVLSHCRYPNTFDSCVIPDTKDWYQDYEGNILHRVRNGRDSFNPYPFRYIDLTYPLGDEQLYRRAMSSNSSEHTKAWHEYRQGDQINPDFTPSHAEKQAAIGKGL